MGAPAAGSGESVSGVGCIQLTAGRSLSRFPPQNLWPQQPHEGHTAASDVPDGPTEEHRYSGGLLLFNGSLLKRAWSSGLFGD